MSFKNIFIFCFMLMCSPAFANEIADIPAVKSLAKDMPEDVASFIYRTVECTHWSGEEPYDKARAEDIKQALEKAGCNFLPKDEEALREKYKGQKKILGALKKAKDILI